MTTYYIYRLENSLKFDKCGATTTWDKRCRDNTASHGPQSIITLLETMEGPNTADMWQIVGDREWELADYYGYPRGTHYRIAREKRYKFTNEQAVYHGRTNGKAKKGKVGSPIPGRASKGVPRIANRKLTFKQAEEIRSKYIPRKYGLHKLGKEYGVDHNVIYRIIQNLCYLKA